METTPGNPCFWLKLILILFFEVEALQKAGTLLKRLKNSQLSDEHNDLEDGLVNIGASTKGLLQSIKVLVENKRKFKRDFKLQLQFFIQVAQKFTIGSQCSAEFIITVSLCYGATTGNMYSKFRALTDKLYIEKNHIDSGW